MSGITGYPYSEFAPGIVEMLALDLPDTVAIFSHENCRRFGGWEALRTHGIANLNGLEVEELATVPTPSGSSFHVLLGDSVYTASRALLLPHLAAELTGKSVGDELGWLMSVPNRHQLVWHVIEDAGSASVITEMARFTAMGYNDAPAPLSPHVFWWDGTNYEQVTEISEEGRLVARVSPALKSALDAISGE
ncbi:hypothetical protein [Paenarthrobacter sp. AMU7]|uniref:Uncharacterized protein n=1 Tax=Paenarthrobacter sp. AMU7 TaxID=3162492 RepID=A0AB39YP73_9MICC